MQHSWKTKLTLLLVSSLTIMSIITISPVLPQISEAFSGVPNSDLLVKLVLTIPALFIAISSPLAGWFVDRYGRLSLLKFGLALYALAGSAGYYINDIYLLLISRAILGIAVGISMTVVITLIADYFQGPERQKFLGIQVAFMSLGGILFIGLGGILGDLGWRFPFLIYLFALLVLPLVFLYLHEPEVKSSMDSKAPAIKVPRVIWLLFINTMFMWIIFFLIPVHIPFHLLSVGVEKYALVGAAIATSTAFSAISSFSYSRIKDRLSFSAVFALGYFLMSIGFVIIALSQSYGLVIIGMIFCGLGIGVMIPNTNMWVLKITPPEVRGREIGRLTTFWFLGQFISPIVIAPILMFLPLSSTFMVAALSLFVCALAFILLSIFQRKTLAQDHF